jgi:exodeoxyribonuclease V beta subunit
MTGSHYILQYHLYCLAVHRYLTLRHPNYDYERDFAGSYYLFLRGMHPHHSPQTGVFFEKPPLARVEALSNLFSAQPPATLAAVQELTS